MAKQKVRTTTTKSYVKKSQVVTDRQGKKHCGTCGAYIGNKGRK